MGCRGLRIILRGIFWRPRLVASVYFILLCFFLLFVYDSMGQHIVILRHQRFCSRALHFSIRDPRKAQSAVTSLLPHRSNHHSPFDALFPFTEPRVQHSFFLLNSPPFTS
jgi:hypothetical protein